MKLTAREIWLRQQREAKLKAAEDGSRRPHQTVTKPFAPVTINPKAKTKP
jgi:hypothetical protein